ncbi:MAG: histidine phosphatase family protein, partial [Clostridia bacterium]|nr:histidine phosphatase family protein [Clostridia bacterium]
MITKICFVRHAESDKTVKDASQRPLTEDGLEKAARLVDFFKDVPVHAVYSSPFKRAIDTVLPLAESRGLEIVKDDRLREWMGGRPFPEEMFFPRMERLFAVRTHAEGGCESISALAKRNVACITQILRRHAGQTVVVGTHALALSAILSHYYPFFGFREFTELVPHTPYVAMVQFDAEACAGMRFCTPFSSPAKDADKVLRVRTGDIGTFGGYKYVVVFTRNNGKWVYCRAKTREGFETAGGHIENSETPLEAAKRELYEETGAKDFDIMPLFDYAVDTPASWANGQVFFASVRSFGPMPDYEMAQIAHFETY